MPQKAVKLLSIVAFATVILGILSWLIFKQVITNQAKEKASEIISLAYEDKKPETPDDKVKAIATQIFQNFEQIDPALVTLYKFRSYVTNKRLPEFLRLQDGVLETTLEKGLCDNAARLLSFVLKQEGFHSVQWDMMTPGGGHAALLVTLPDDRKIYVDPLFGVAATDKFGKLIHPDEAYKLIQAGRRPEAVFIALF